MNDNADLDTSKIPQRLSKRYLSTLSEEERTLVLEYKQNQSRLIQLEHSKSYQKRNKEKINEYQRNRRQKIRDQRILEEAKRIQKLINVH